MSHQLFLNLDVRAMAIGKRDVIFAVYKHDEKFGELRISRGAIVWRGRKDKDGRKLGWKRFDELMQSTGRRAERRRKRATSVPKRKRTRP